MVVTCDIQFDNNPQGIYYAGQVLTGKINLTSDKVKQVKAVCLKINGFAHTSWRENKSKSSSNNTSRSTHYSGHVDYVKSLTNLLSPEVSDEPVLIEPGIHTFSFACHIPINCPSSFEGYDGHIRYIIQIKLIRPWKFDVDFSRGFTVLKVMNLNYDSPLLKMPVSTEIQKVFCCGPFKSDPLQMHIQLPQSGYVPGQLIPVSVLVTNDTKVPIDEICLRLVMMVCLYSMYPMQRSKNETMTVAELKGDPVLQHCKKHFNYLLPIPATPPTCFNLCTIIQIAYRVEVEAKMNGVMYANQCIHTPVTIGNVPLQMNGVVVEQQPTARQFISDCGLETESEVAIMTMQESSKSDNNNEPSASQHHKEPWSTFGNTVAPVYVEASHMPQGKLSPDSAHDYGDKNFSPKYPVFNIPSPATELKNSVDDTDGHMTSPSVTDPKKTTWL